MLLLTAKVYKNFSLPPIGGGINYAEHKASGQIQLWDGRTVYIEISETDMAGEVKES